jgi:transketolase
MGDQLGEIVEGELVYISESEIRKLLRVSDKHARASLFADAIRLNALYMIARAGSGHIGSSFSSAEIFAWLYLNEVDDATTFFSSKGHDAPGLYAALIATGQLEQDLIHRLRRSQGLPGHPDVAYRGVSANTGSLGMGISKAKGMIRAHRIRGEKHRVFVLTGDGELQEGQIWESLASAANEQVTELTVLIDHNKLQSDTFVSLVSELGDLEAKFSAFGWEVHRIDGHDTREIEQVLAKEPKSPRAIICDTVKGRGVTFMEHTALMLEERWYRFHSGAPSRADYQKASQEICNRLEAGLRASDIGDLVLSRVVSASQAASTKGKVHRLIDAYSDQLAKAGEVIERLVVLDADLIKDTGVAMFAELYPNRFVECGIAEQDMVSQASGLALSGMLPVVHSFSCFLSSRPNEQIYNAATEKKKIIYVGSLAGVLPGGPGHSHQGVRDLGALSGVPNLVFLQPATEEETRAALDFAIADERNSYYLRLVSVPSHYEIDPKSAPLSFGRGNVVLEGDPRVTLLSSGPTLLSQAMSAAQSLGTRGETRPRVVNMPFLNRIDRVWLEELCQSTEVLIIVDDHYVEGGLGCRIAAEISLAGIKTLPVVRAIETIPAFGSAEEVLAFHGLNAETLSQLILRYR